MSTPFVVAVPSKGRLQENAEGFFARAGLMLSKAGGARDYRGTIAYRTKTAGVLLKRTAAIAAQRAGGH